jgi:hypothetical protein
VDNIKIDLAQTAHSLTHSWSWALLEKPPIVQLLKNFPAFYGTRRFITVLGIKMIVVSSALTKKIENWQNSTHSPLSVTRKTSLSYNKHNIVPIRYLFHSLFIHTEGERRWL